MRLSMSRVPQGQWFSSGNDFIIDGLWGRLGVQESFGKTHVSGATNVLAAVKEPLSGNIFLYAGSVNGGLYLRLYNHAKDRWSKEWTWLSNPRGEYQGSQGISFLAPSPSGEFLAVGQGNPSNYFAVSAPSRGLQLGRIGEDGKLTWLQLSEGDQRLLNGLNIRSLLWTDDSIAGTAWDPDVGGSSFSLEFDGQSVVNIEVEDRGYSNLVCDGISNYKVEAGYQADTGISEILLNGRAIQVPDPFRSMLELSNERIGRVSVYPSLMKGSLVAFIGTYLSDPMEAASPIWRIIRLVLNPSTGEVMDAQTTNPEPPYLPDDGDLSTFFGSNQANNSRYYGNFSFEVDPYDPKAKSIFVGGNQYSRSPLAASTLYTGGLVRVDFRKTAKPTLQPLYGPRIDRSSAEVRSGEVDLNQVLDGELVVPFNPGAPHADSRSIAFVESAHGPRLIQADDGGVWQLPVTRTPKGLQQTRDAWWSSLSSTGMATLELNQVDWNSSHNSIISSYQDNASSIGYLGEDFATNLNQADGQIALFDDAKGNRVRGYMAPQQYYQYGFVFAVDYDADGFIKSRRDMPFYLLNDDMLYNWDDTKESTVDNARFMLPAGLNPYVSGSLVQTGYFNVYEQVDAGVFDDVAIFFRPLLPLASEQQIKPTALDVDSISSNHSVQSLYVGAYSNDGITILGRPSSTDVNAFAIKPLSFSNLTQADLDEAGQIVDIAHAQAESGDLLYWLQGGTSLSYGFRLPTTSPDQQVVRVGRAGGDVQAYSLDELGLPLLSGDQYGYQALQYIPASSSHPALLLIAGLQGVWSSELDLDGQPRGFSPMAWEGLPDSGPGAYIRSLQYDPVDDLLIAATQGKGSYLYSFSGDVGSRPIGKRILHASNLNLPPNLDPTLDKRGNESNALISFALDGRLLEQSDQPELQFRLHNASAWRKVMEFVSLYNTNVDPSYKSLTAATDSAFRYNNILDPLGLAFAGGVERRGDVFFSVDLDGGARIFNLSVNPKDVAQLGIKKPLKYSVRLSGTGERLTRKVTFDPLPSPGVVQSSVDVVTGLLAGGVNSPSSPALHGQRSAVFHEGHNSRGFLFESDLAPQVEPSSGFASTNTRLEPAPLWPAFLHPSEALLI